MEKAIWQLLMEDSSELNCDQCFAMVELFAEVLASNQAANALIPFIQQRLANCPMCTLEYQQALERLVADHGQE